MLQKQRTYTINLHLCCKCKSLKKNVISHLSTGTASLEYYISGSPNSKMIRSSEWGQTHHSPADRTLPVSHIQPPKCTELAAILHLGKDQQKLGFNKDRMGHDVSHTHTHTKVHQLSLLIAPYGPHGVSKPSLTQEGKGIWTACEPRAKLCNEGCFQGNLSSHSYLSVTQVFHIKISCVCVCPFVCWQVIPLSKFKTLQSEAGDHIGFGNVWMYGATSVLALKWSYTSLIFVAKCPT